MNNTERLLQLKQAKLKFKEKQLELQHKKGADTKTIHQTMKDINKIQKEINTLK